MNFTSTVRRMCQIGIRIISVMDFGISTFLLFFISIIVQ